MSIYYMLATLLHPNKLKMEWKQHVLGAHRVVSFVQKMFPR